MQKLKLGVNRFTFGEVSPLLAARNDLIKYQAGCRTLENFIPLLQGPARRRGGTRFIAETGSSGRPVILVEFTRSETTAYVIELGATYVAGVERGYARFFRNGQLMRDSTGAVYKIFTPWKQADLFNSHGLPALKWVQSADVLFVVCPTVPPYRINRFGDTNWTLSNLGGWGIRGNAQAIALWKERMVLAVKHKLYFSQSGAFENFDVKADAAIQYVTVNPYSSIAGNTVVEVNAANFRGQVTVLPGEATITVSGTVATISAIDTAAGLSRVDVTVLEGSPYGWNMSVSGGAVTAGHNGSEGNKYTQMWVHFDPVTTESSTNTTGGDGVTLRPRADVVADDDPIEIEIMSEQVDDIAWLSPGEDLLVGTVGGEFAVGPQSNADPLGPRNIKIVPQTAFGSSSLQALRIGSVLLFAQRSGMKVREFVYDAYSENYVAGDVTAAAEHITRGGLMAMAWQSEPLETVWMIRADGVLLGLTYSRDQEMAAWHRHKLGGDGFVSHLAVIPAAHGGRDELWLSVRRKISGQTVYYLERLEMGHEPGEDQAECFFVDSGVTVRGAGLTSIGGLGHLEGFEVDILADGGPLPAKTVSSGRITLERPADVIQVGLGYRSTLETVNVDLEMRDGVSQGRIKRFTQVQLYLIESLGGSVGDMESGAMTGLVSRIGSTPLDSPPGLFTGLKTINWPGSYDRQSRIGIVQDSPLPLTLAAVYPAVSVEGMRS